MTKPVAKPEDLAAHIRLRHLLIGTLIGALLTAVIALVFRPASSSPSSGGVPIAAYLALNRTAAGVVQTHSGLQYKQLAAGRGDAKPTDTDVALINYEGRLADGTTFDKSPRATPLAVAGVVPGFAEALKLMSKGARYRVWIPPALGYGNAATGPIPPSSLLVFDIELVDFQSQAVVDQLNARGAGRKPG